MVATLDLSTPFDDVGVLVAVDEEWFEVAEDESEVSEEGGTLRSPRPSRFNDGLLLDTRSEEDIDDDDDDEDDDGDGTDVGNLHGAVDCLGGAALVLFDFGVDDCW